MLTTATDEATVRAAFANGGMGYLVTPAPRTAPRRPSWKGAGIDDSPPQPTQRSHPAASRVSAMISRAESWR